MLIVHTYVHTVVDAVLVGDNSFVINNKQPQVTFQSSNSSNFSTQILLKKNTDMCHNFNMVVSNMATIKVGKSRLYVFKPMANYIKFTDRMLLMASHHQQLS